MTKSHKFTTLAEIAALTPEEFGRMLPDFVLWHSYASTGHTVGLVALGFDWIDDGKPGELSHVTIDGEVVVKGPAFSEDHALRVGV